MAEPTSIDRRFDLLKQKASQDVQSQQQQAQKGLTRQFARLGGIGTGAFVKQQALAQEAGNKQLGEAKNTIEMQRLAELQRQDDIKNQQAFQTSERMGAQQFATGERTGAQGFAAAQAELARKFQTGERVSSQEFQQGLADASNAIARGQLDITTQTLGMENNVNYLNARLQIAEGIKKGLFSSEDLANINEMFFPDPNKGQPGFVDPNQPKALTDPQSQAPTPLQTYESNAAKYQSAYAKAKAIPNLEERSRALLKADLMAGQMGLSAQEIRDLKGRV